MEISKMLTISTCHVREGTADLLDRAAAGEMPGNPEFPVVYLKDEYGWFISIGNFIREFEEGEDSSENVPDDLAGCIQFARENGCDWLCLDRDGEEVPDLTSYDW